MIVKEGTALGASLRKALGDHMEFNSKHADTFSQQALDSAVQGKDAVHRGDHHCRIDDLHVRLFPW